MINTNYKHFRCKPQQGIVLLEALIAILIFSIGILGLVGLQAVMIKNSTDARFRSDASVIAQQRIGQIWSSPALAGAFLEPGTDISAVLPNGTRSTSQISPGEFLVIVSWSPPTVNGVPEIHTYKMLARVDP